MLVFLSNIRLTNKFFMNIFSWKVYRRVPGSQRPQRRLLFIIFNGGGDAHPATRSWDTRPRPESNSTKRFLSTILVIFAGHPHKPSTPEEFMSTLLYLYALLVLTVELHNRYGLSYYLNNVDGTYFWRGRVTSFTREHYFYFTQVVLVFYF